MNKKITKIVYTDEPIKLGKTVVAKDFLPPPEALVFKQDTKKVTMSLTSESITFFKQQAKKHDVKYQVMIRNLLDKYTRSLSPATSVFIQKITDHHLVFYVMFLCLLFKESNAFTS